MATKTTSTTDNIAGCSPCTPEAHQRSDFESPGEFDLEEAAQRLAIYIREHAVPMTHFEDRVVTCNGCIHLDQADCEDGVGWCNFHWQYRSIRTSRTCEGAQFFN